MKLRKAATILVVLVCAAIQVSSALAQGVQTDGPLTKNKLMKMLLLNDSSQQDLIKLITHNGVDFRPTPTEEADLHEAGGSDDLIVAVRANFRGLARDNSPANQAAIGPAATNEAPSQRSSQTANETAAPQKKKGFLEKLNSGMDKTNAKLTKINSEVNKQTQAVQATATQAAQTAQTLKTQATQTAQSLKTSGQAMTSKGQSNANDQTATSNATSQANASSEVAAPVVANNGNATQSIAAPTSTSDGNNPASSGAAPADLAGTSWDLLSMTKQGETEHVNETTPNVQFCRDGSWAILHAGSSEGGKYQIQGSRIVMKTSDGALYGDYQIKRNGNEMVLDDGTWRLRLRYYSPVKC